MYRGVVPPAAVLSWLPPGQDFYNNNNPAYILIKPRMHKANVLDPKSKKKQKPGGCIWMQVEHGREVLSGNELNLNLRSYLT